MRMDRLPISGNVPAEVAERLSDAPEAPLEIPDFAEADTYIGVVGDDLRDPLATLFATRDQILVLQQSDAFRNVVNKERALEWLLRDLAALERSLYSAWADA
jgi:hypothetical protein